VGNQRPDDQAAATRLGADLGLGDLRMVLRAHRYGPAPLLGGLLVFVTAIAGPVAIVADAGAAQAINTVVFVGLFFLGGLMLGLGIARASVTRRLFLYSGGLAELTDDQPEPRVVRWADVEAVTITYLEREEYPDMLHGCTLHARGGDTLALGKYRPRALRSLASEADRVLAPRLVPPLIAAYESGEPVTMGDARIDRSGVTVGLQTGSRIAWTDMRSVTISFSASSSDAAAAVKQIYFRPRSGTMCSVRASGVSNGVFLPHLVAHAAARNGVRVICYPRRLSDRIALGASGTSSHDHESI
jgi:hypothetical protein